MESFVQEDLNSVEFFDSFLGFCAGDNGTFLQANPDGLTWSEKDLGAEFDLNDICTLQPNKIWVVGDKGAIFFSNDLGVNWESQLSDTSVSLNTVFFLDGMNGWAAGWNSVNEGVVLQTTNGGEVWEEISEAGLPEISVVFFTDPEKGWAVMSPGYVYKTLDGGMSWTFQFPDIWSSSLVRDIFFPAPDLGWAVGISYTVPVPKSFILHTSDGGESWEPQEDNSWGGFNGVHFTDPQHSCAVGNTGSITCTPDGGNNWVVISGAYCRPTLHDIFFINDQVGWAAGGQLYPGTTILANTLDGGASWTEVEMEGYVFYDLFFINQQKGWIAGGPTVSSGEPVIMHTNDGGFSWENQYTGSTWHSMQEIYFLDDQTGWAMGGSIQTIPPQGLLFLKTMNGGEDWEDQSWISEKFLAEMCFTDDDLGWIAGHETILHTMDGGETWLEHWSGVHSWKAVCFTDADHGWVLGDSLAGFEFSDVLMSTTDGGLNWEKQYFDLHLEDVFFTDTELGWLSGADGVILSSQDGGNTWESMSSSTNHALKELFFMSPVQGWAVGGSSTILHLDSGGITSIPNRKNQDLHFVNFPNPINSYTTFRFTLAEAGFLSLQLYDVQGQYHTTIFSKHFRRGLQQVFWDASGLQRGVYIVCLQSENGRRTSKIVKR